MSKYDTFKTKKGTELPLMNLKGKPYMQVAQRLIWFTEEADRYTVNTSFPVLTPEETVAHVIVTMYDKEGRVSKQAEATKREDKKSFADHTEKAETGAIGRALAMLGFGTQFAIADLEEGDRLADSPIAINITKSPTTSTTKQVAAEMTTDTTAPEVPKKKVSFSKKSIMTQTQTGDDI